MLVCCRHGKRSFVAVSGIERNAPRRRHRTFSWDPSELMPLTNLASRPRGALKRRKWWLSCRKFFGYLYVVMFAAQNLAGSACSMFVCFFSVAPSEIVSYVKAKAEVAARLSEARSCSAWMNTLFELSCAN